MKLTITSTLKLNNGVEMPMFGLGTFLSEKGTTTENAVLWALKAGYRHIDTAMIYSNEEDVGKAVQASGINRQEIFLTTKVWNDDQGYESTLKACNASLIRLGMDYVDLYLIHWPVKGLRSETWSALIKLQEQGKCRAIGVSNYTIRHLKELLPNTNVVPAINQFEINPFLYRKELLEYCQANHIEVTAYASLCRARKLEDPRLQAIAAKYGKTPAQVALRWGLQHRLIVIPKSVHRERIIENTLIYDFDLLPEDMAVLDNMNENFWVVPTSMNPETSPSWE